MIMWMLFCSSTPCADHYEYDYDDDDDYYGYMCVH